MTHRLVGFMLLFIMAASTPQIAHAFIISDSFDSDAASFVGTNGWEGSYCADPWTAALNGGVFPLTDDGCGLVQDCNANYNCGFEWAVYQGCAETDPLDNHIQFGSDLWQDYVYTARFINTDNDSVGLVFRYRNSGDFYLVFFTRDMAPAAGVPCPISFVGSRVYRIHDTQAVMLAQSSVSYTPGTEHAVRITATGNDFAIEFDANGDGSFAPTELLFDFTDSVGPSHGKVGFWAYDNGVGGDSTCAIGDCWFDDLSVDVLSLANDPCGGISYEGVCTGNTLKYCQNGQVIQTNCQGCCMWFQQSGYYSCGNWQACQGCTNECNSGQTGCSAELTHAWTCGQADDDDCSERIYQACDATGICDPTTHACLGAVCEPDCAGKNCGSDGCGGSCGSCGAGQKCQNGQCACAPSCAGKTCGDDGCGGSCGTCAGNAVCTNGACLCTPACAGKACGPDGCGGACGTCGQGEVCTNGQCACVPACAGKQCGADGCGGSCGTCPEGLACTKNGTCECQTQCLNLECGDDGCGGNCGFCLVGETCVAGLCLCLPACENKECGPDTCGGTCGVCGANEACQDGLCVCLPDCAGKACGPDGCGGLCGSCQEGFFCEGGECKEGQCVPACDGKECGDDGCGNLCGQCPDNQECLTDICQEIVCEPKCIDKTCGPDGCGGSCGDCAPGEVCDAGNCHCLPLCDGKDCGDDGCGGLCGDCLDGWYCKAGTCTEGECVPECTDKACGDDGCGGSCGQCTDDLQCENFQCVCAPQCDGKDCGVDGCGGVCGECQDGWYCKYGTCTENECLGSCAGKECGDDGCGGVCGTCGDGYDCTVKGQCEEVSDCTPKAAVACIDDALVWIDSCGEPGETVQVCDYGCTADACNEPPVAFDIVGEGDLLDSPDAPSAASGETVTFDSGSKSGGCTTNNTNPLSALLLLSLLVGLALLSRRTA